MFKFNNTNNFGKSAQDRANVINTALNEMLQGTPNNEKFSARTAIMGMDRQHSNSIAVVYIGFQHSENLLSVKPLVPFKVVQGETFADYVERINLQSFKEQIGKLFETDPEHIQLLDPMVEIDDVPVDLYYLSKLMEQIAEELMLSATTHAYLAEIIPHSDFTMWHPDAPRPLKYIMEHEFSDGSTANLLNMLVRDDVRLTLKCQPPQHRNNQNNNPSVLMLTVTGYVDFKLSASSYDPTRPWLPKQPRFLPEFVITGMHQSKAGSEQVVASLYEEQANVFALHMASSFMRSGEWVNLFKDHYLTNSARDVAALARDWVGVRSFYRHLENVIDPGYLLSVDMENNTPTRYSAFPLHASTREYNMFFNKILPLFIDSFSEKAESKSASFSYSEITGGAMMHQQSTRLPSGSFVDGDKRVRDIRYVDYLYLSNTRTQKVAERWVDVVYEGIGMHFSSYGPTPAYNKRLEILSEESQVRVVGKHDRMTLTADVMQGVEKAMNYVGIVMVFKTAKPQRPTVAPGQAIW